MSDFTVKKKLELMQQIRSRYQRDRYDMSSREKILYGRTTPIKEENYSDSAYAYEEEEEAPASTFPLRLFLAAAAFALLILSDRTGRDILGVSASKCFEAISADYESSIAAWTDAASHMITTDDDQDYDDRPLKNNPPAGIRP